MYRIVIALHVAACVALTASAADVRAELDARALIGPDGPAIHKPADRIAAVQPLDAIKRHAEPALDLAAVKSDDAKRNERGEPPRYAIPRPVSMTPRDSGTWEALPDGVSLWRLRISSPGAVSINFGFTRYLMPPGGRLLVYNATQTHLIRPFTDLDNAEHGQLWTPPVAGDDVVIEVTLPADAVPQLELELGSINIGYRPFAIPKPLAAPVEKSGSCNVDVACSQADPWRDVIDAVGVISTGGSTFCTGFMVTNTAGDQTPFFMTAFHCGISAGNAASLMVFWNYQNSFCRTPGSAASGNPGDGNLSRFQTGSFFRAGSSTSDFTLVELDEAPNPAWGVAFAGWDRRNQNSPSGACIHHPSTDEKRITLYSSPTEITSYFGDTSPGDGTHLHAFWSLGVTEPGSSGSPLFDVNRRVIGQLHGGPSSCSASDKSDYYGRFFRSWTGGGTNATRLSNWLDPGNTGAETTNTITTGGTGGAGGGGGGAPGNDDCASASDVGTGTHHASNSTATTDGSASCGGTNGGNHDVWWSFTAPSDGMSFIDTDGSNFDTTLSVFSACGGMQIACDDDSGEGLQSSLSFEASAGTSYLVRVAGYGNATGAITLSISHDGSGPPCPIPCAIFCPMTLAGLSLLMLGLSFAVRRTCRRRFVR
ncbi:MAG: S1 family peptidase [Phycisphaerae bacterium]|nr:S1 family peptidase [Phycisphaerae bacterium]